MAGKRICPHCNTGEHLKEVPPVRIELPTPRSEFTSGPGGNPGYATEVKLPFVYCARCDTVLFMG